MNDARFFNRFSGKPVRPVAFAILIASLFCLVAVSNGEAAPGPGHDKDNRPLERARDPLGFEECAKRALQHTSDVRAVYRECEAAANAFVARQEFSDPNAFRRGVTPPDAQARIAELERSPGFVERRDLAQAFEACAQNSFSQDQSVQNVFKRCDGDLQQYLATFPEAQRTTVDLHVRAATHHALTEQSIEAATQSEDES